MIIIAALHANRRLQCWPLLLLAALLGCVDTGPSNDTGWRAEYDTIGDTIVVRTLSGSVWGDTAVLAADLRIGRLDGPDEYTFGQIRSLAVAPDGSIYLYEAHANELRKYGPDGTFVMTIGRQGGGPGEYRRADAGLAVLPDGRVLLRDPGNTRINVYSAEGVYQDGWRIRGFWSGLPLHADTAGNAYPPVLLDPQASVRDWEIGLVRYSASGVPGDTIPEPRWDYEIPRMYAGSGNRMADWGIPFTPRAAWTFSPLGYRVGGVPASYGFNLYLAPDRVRRIERANWQPVPVVAGEREEQESLVTMALRRTEPGWRWNGPPIPDIKPPYKGFFIGQRGRIWVQLHTEARQLSQEAAGPPESAPWMQDFLQRWVETAAFDVFEPDGRYLGRVEAPEPLLMRPPPIARGDTVWAVVPDPLGVPSVVRFHLEHGAAGPT
ncbi:MAG TPA: hypothetical protein VLC48_10240 [Gemmatimonadota bacterium]|nr:hypothetical protein [Gemmatimonadota bacterium]